MYYCLVITQCFCSSNVERRRQEEELREMDSKNKITEDMVSGCPIYCTKTANGKAIGHNTESGYKSQD